MTMLSHKQYRKKNEGFTLVEAMIAVTILVLSIAGPLFTANRALVAAEIARDELTASYLAQEGVEYVRAMRDDTYLSAYQAGGSGASAAAWTDFLTGSSAGSVTPCRTAVCTLDPARSMGAGSGFALEPCPGGTCSPLYLVNNIYTEQGGLSGAEVTPFTRTIQVSDISANEVRVVSQVSWTFHGSPYQITVTDHLTPWQ